MSDGWVSAAQLESWSNNRHESYIMDAIRDRPLALLDDLIESRQERDEARAEIAKLRAVLDVLANEIGEDRLAELHDLGVYPAALSTGKPE